MEIANLKIHHVGIIYNDMNKAEQFIKRFGLREEYRGYVDAYQAWCIFLEPNGGSKIELIVPTGGILRSSTTAKEDCTILPLT